VRAGPCPPHKSPRDSVLQEAPISGGPVLASRPLWASARDKVLRVSRTIADLEGSDEMKPQYIAEAVVYRSLDERVWT
jgi:predicted ATPase with chaperone activity